MENRKKLCAEFEMNGVVLGCQSDLNYRLSLQTLTIDRFG